MEPAVLIADEMPLDSKALSWEDRPASPGGRQCRWGEGRPVPGPSPCGARGLVPLEKF